MPGEPQINQLPDPSIQPEVIEVDETSSVPDVVQLVEEIGTRQRLAALFVRASDDWNEEALSWLDTFAGFWASHSEHQNSPWGALRALPLIVVDAKALQFSEQEKFLSWGISSLTDVSTADELQQLLARSIARAEALNLMFEEAEDPVSAPSAVRPERPQIPAEVYSAAFQALRAMEEQSGERED